MTTFGRILPDSTPGSFIWRVEDFFAHLQGRNDYSIESPRFSALDAEWYLHILTPTKGNASCARLSLRTYTSVVAHFYFGIRGRDDAELIACSGEARDTGLGRFSVHIELSAYWRQHKEEFAPDGVLSVFCHLRVKGAQRRPSATTGNDTSTQTEDGLSISCNSPGAHKVVENLKELLSNEDACDVTLKVQNQEFQAHKALLVARSSVFRAMFCHEMLEKLDNEVLITDCDTDTFRIFLRHVYTGDAEGLSMSNAFDVYSVANKYDATELKIQCRDCIASSITVETVCDVVAFSLLHGDPVLLEMASEFFAKHFSQILLTNKWQSFLRDHTTAANELLIKASKFHVPPE